MLIEIIREAWMALRRNYTRSLLTMLGIVWGIATVTLLIAYGSSFRHILVSGFDAFGKSVVICWPQQTSEQPGGQRAGKKVLLEQADLDIVKADRKSTRLNSSHANISYAVFCLKKKETSRPLRTSNA